ncbi:hypothetical protein LLEC1_01220 [Akanthomyces lecanii]|uniref:Telomeric single stranded DNA binding POT1/Cdc13 domain-containing protein n=1 Tax=Cordyceps confragosa TaxID=2714763 RepID=A0A179I840_CORDF|nr:hypothetical protein LLEC1_01220 [Akanthomyces lecanii]
MPPRIMLLAGAPSPSRLDEEECTIQKFTEPFHDFIEAAAGAADDNGTASSGHAAPASAAPKWRSLSLHRKPLHTGFSQANNFLDSSFQAPYKGDDFFCPSSLTSSCDGDDTAKAESDEAALSEFCEQSLAIHNSQPSSQLEDDDDENATTTFLDETSFLSTTTTTSAARPPAPAIPPAHLSDLEDVPSAKQVASLQPQTITLNLIAGILSTAQPRAVTTRWGQTLSLVEVLLGDDTRSGFAVTFWLSSEAAAAATSSSLLSLRRQDVVLLQNVALHVFRGKVYGQSLRRGQTRVHLLWSRRRDARASYTSKALAAAVMDGTGDPQLVKTRVVRDWVIQYVGTDPEVKGLKKHNVWDRPPQDTQ